MVDFADRRRALLSHANEREEEWRYALRDIARIRDTLARAVSMSVLFGGDVVRLPARDAAELVYAADCTLATLAERAEGERRQRGRSL